MNYAGFWRRFGAFWLDFIILSPLMFLSIWGENKSQYFQIYYFIPGLIFGLWFNVYLVKLYGGTPGKLILNLKIRQLNGSPVKFKQAFIRHSVLFIISTLSSFAYIIGDLSITKEVYHSMQWFERSKEIQQNLPSWHLPLQVLMNVWIWSEFIVMLTNKKRRAIHDYMAGTVVLVEKKELMENDKEAQRRTALVV